MILDQLYPRKINESLADEFMAMARAKGMNPRLRGTPDQERARTDAMMKQRAADRANAPKPQPIDAETRGHLQDQLKSLEAKFDPNYEYSDDHGFWKEQSSIAQQINRIKAELSRGISESRQRQLNEAKLMEDPVYRNFKKVGRYIAERKMSEKEILQVFADAEAGMTDKGTGANRTMLGRGKDTTMDFAGGVADALKGVWGGIQNSVPVAAVDVAYDQATDALANLTGGQKGAVMQAIKKYRMLAKQYPKTAGLSKAALVAIAGLATGGAGLPAVAALVYGLDSSIKGDKLSDIALKAGGAAATAWAAGKLFGGGTQPDSTDSIAGLVDPTPDLATYTVKSGDTLSQIAQANNTSVQELIGLNPQLAADSSAVGGQSLNPDVIFPGQEITLPPGTPGTDVYAGGVGTNSNTMADIARGQVPNSAITQGMAARNAVRESVKYRARILHANRLIDQKATVLNWALSESVGRQSHSVNLTTVGAYTVFENVDRYRKAIMELKGVPGSTRPEYYRPDMMDAPTKPDKKPGLIGRGLNALDRGVKKVGGALSNFGHQFTTNVTKEKLKMNWHQAGKPSDSDQLAAWLTKQGVPQEVVTSVYGKMSIPYTPQADPAKAQVAEPQAATTGGAQRSMPFYGTNPATKKPWTYDELQAKAQAGATPAPAPEPAAKTTQPTSNLPGFNATNVMNLPGMQNVKKPAPAPAKTPNFAGPTGYGKTTMSVKPMTGIPGMKAPATPATPKAPTAPKAPGIKYNINLPTGGGAGVKAAAEPGKLSKDEYIRRIGAPAMPESRVFNALKKPIAEMLSMVETKEDVARIKQFVDQTFVKYGAVSESAFAVRNRLIEHVTQVGAQRRREFARKS